MPQVDRYKSRIVPIEFEACEDFSQLPYPDRYTLVLITGGALHGGLHGLPLALDAPAVLCLSPEDGLLVQQTPFAAQSFRFSPDFMDTIPITPTEYFAPNLKIKTGLSLFGGDARPRVPRVSPAAYQQLFEWFFVLGTEVYAQSSSNWVCRVKKYLIQILGMLEDLNRQAEPTPVDAALEYIYTNYREKIALEDLTACAHMNRVSLNELFHNRFGTTAMGYLQEHRFKVAADLLVHTGMSLQEIAHATGFGYDTYFIKRFKAHRGMTPTEYRNFSRHLADKV